MSHLDDVGEADSWRCWLCDEPVDRNMSSNDPRGASIDTRITKARAKKLKKDKSPPPPKRSGSLRMQHWQGSSRCGREMARTFHRRRSCTDHRVY